MGKVIDDGLTGEREHFVVYREKSRTERGPIVHTVTGE